jgi:hypothetical protein
MAESLGSHFLAEALASFHGTKSQAERAMEQVGDEDFFRVLDPESNSIALVVKHMAGNMRSRWTDFLTSDGEKPDRDRDTEFESFDEDTRAALMRRWEDGWARVFAAVEPLTEADLLRTVTIRAEPHSVLKAINRQLTHYAHHTGQIVFLAKHFASSEWKTLSVARGHSAAFNEKMMGGK